MPSSTDRPSVRVLPFLAASRPHRTRLRLRVGCSWLHRRVVKAFHRCPVGARNEVAVGVDRDLNARVSEHQLNDADVHAVRQQPAGALVTQVVPVQVDLPQLLAIDPNPGLPRPVREPGLEYMATLESEMEAAIAISYPLVEKSPTPLLIGWIRDQAEHYGKLVSNYRAVGIVPPISRKPASQ